MLGKDAGAVDSALERAERFASRATDVGTQTWWLYGRGLARLHGPRYDPEGAVADFERCNELLNAPVLPESFYNRG